MKKVLVMFFALLMAVVLVGCGSGGQAGTEQTPQPAPADVALDTQSFINSLKSGNFGFDYSATVEFQDNSITSTGVIAKKDKDVAFKSNTEIAGNITELRIIIQNKKMTIVNDTSKTAVEQKYEAPDGTGPDAFAVSDFSNLVMKGSGEEEVNGKLLQYEEYELEGSSMKFYSDNGQIAAIGISSKDPATGIEATSIMEISNVTTTPDVALFEIPSDYTVNKL